MAEKDPRIDAYIALAPEFARPILVELRELVHHGCPEVVETLKWSAPAFEHHGLLAQMAAFKAHCRFGFWKDPLIFQGGAEREVAGRLQRLASVDDLPPRKALVGWIERAAALNAGGVKTAKRKRQPKP